MKPQPRYQPGDRIGGRYQVHDVKLGGMGEVYLCLDLEELPYALKTFQQRYLTNPRLREAFENEVAIWVALEKHPNIVRCHYLDIVDNQPFIRLEWIVGDEERGTDLRGWLRNGPLDLRTTLDILIDICRALQHAQRIQPGIVHCDLKPENILIARDGLAKVTDFGLAQIVQSAQLNAIDDDSMNGDLQILRSINGVAGTPLYMSPEQWKGEVLDLRTDIYAIGCILFEMLVGRRPFQAATTSGLCRQHCLGDIPKASIQADLPQSLDALLMTCMAKSRKERFATIEALLEQLEHIYQQEFQTAPRKLLTLEEYQVMDYSNRGNVYHQLRRYDKALADHNAAVALDPTYARAYHNRGATLHNMELYEDALADFNRALELDPTLEPISSNRALVYHALKQFDKALLDHEQAIALHPDWATAYANRGLTYFELQNFDNALVDYNRAIQLSPTYAKAYLHRGKLLYKQAEYNKALADYNEVIALDPMLVNAYDDRGLVHAKLGRWTESLRDYNSALELDPYRPTTLSNRGRLYVELQRYEDAFCDYDQALQFDPTYAIAYNNRGNLYHSLEQFVEALQDRTRALEFDPTDATAYYNRGVTYTALKEYAAALADYTRAIELDPNYAQAYSNRGVTYTALREDTASLADYTQAITLDPNFATAYLNIGALLAKQGSLQEALPYFDRAAQFGDPQGAPYAAQVRQMLGMEPDPPNDPAQVAFAAFQQADSVEAMQQAPAHFPLLLQPDFIVAIEQAIAQQVPLADRPALTQRLTWLRQIASTQRSTQ